MAYALDTDLGRRLDPQKLIDLTDFEGDGDIDTGRAQAACDSASAMIDSYCGGRYQLPLQPSDQVVDVCLDIAVFKLYVGRQRKIPETVQNAYDQAMKYLGDVSSGKASLAQASVPQNTELNTVTRNHCTDPEVFDKKKLEGY